MKGLLPFCFLLPLSLSAAALDDGHARYVGGTVPGLASGVVGRLDTTSKTSLTFQQAGNKLEIPYASIESYEYSKEVTRHLGVLPAIAVGMVKMRRHSHFFSISYRGEDGAPAQIVVFEVPKDMPRTLEAILQTRAPGTCKPCHSSHVPPALGQDTPKTVPSAIPPNTSQR
jgi:hypothetical protein